MSMRSKNSSSTSEAPSKAVPRPWEDLLDSREWLVKARDLHSSHLWDCLREQLQAERYLYLEALAETDDDKERSEYSFVAKWIKRFIADLPEEIEARFQYFKDEDAGKIEHLDPKNGGTAFMESDGDSMEVPFTEPN